ncbi:MAG: hypothetical protein GY853_03875 [PVC group bacterium]|nr:hypothetical protein [PVC group bacterium]
MKALDKNNIKYRNLLSEENWQFLILFLIAFFVRLVFLMITDNFTGPQTMLKIITASHILNFPGLIHNVYYQHLPFHLYSLAGCIWVGIEQILAGRFLSLFLGTLSVIPFYFLCKSLFYKKNAFFSALIFCFFPEQIMRSIVTDSHASAIFFVIISLYFFTRHNFILSAIILAIGSGYGYICWLFVPILTFSIILFDVAKGLKKAKNVFIFLGISVVVPIVFLLLTRAKYGNLYCFIHNFFEQDSFSEYFYYFALRIRTFGQQIIWGVHPGFFLLAVVGMISELLKKRYQPVVFWFLSLFLLVCLGVFHYLIPVMTQAILVCSLFLIPFSIEGVRVGLNTLRINSRFLKFTMILLFCIFSLWKTTLIRPLIPAFIKDASQWLKCNVSTEDMIVIDNNEELDDYHTSIVMLSGMPPSIFYYGENSFNSWVDSMPNDRKQYLVSCKINAPFISGISMERIIDFSKCRIFTMKDSL